MSSVNNTIVYDLDYYAGSQIGIYIGDIFVDEVTSLNFAIQHSKTPIYGYASQLFDAVSSGPILVQGSFTINFKESAYLIVVLDRLKALAGEETLPGFDKVGKKAPGNPLIQSTITPNPNKPDETIFNKNFTLSHQVIEAIIQDSSELNRKNEFQTYLAIAAGIAKQSASGQRSILSQRAVSAAPIDHTYEDIAEKFEDRLWQTNKQKGTDFANEPRRADHSRWDGFDIVITYGDFSDNAYNHTAKKLVGVHLTGSAQQLTIDDGRPVQEEYTFFAQDIV